MSFSASVRGAAGFVTPSKELLKDTTLCEILRWLLMHTVGQLA